MCVCMYIYLFSFQVSELRAKLSGSKDQSGALRKQLDDMENSRRQMEQTLLQTREERENL